MIKFIAVCIITLLFFSGCSTKKINENVNSITSDISNVFEEGKDKSKD